MGKGGGFQRRGREIRVSEISILEYDVVKSGLDPFCPHEIAALKADPAEITIGEIEIHKGALTEQNIAKIDLRQIESGKINALENDGVDGLLADDDFRLGIALQGRV